jgi:formiminoglutamase
MFQYFFPAKKSDIAARVHVRSGETKLGELIEVPEDGSLVSFLQETSARFVVLGVAEDIGVLANGGKAGTAGAWDSFLSSFLNIQANDFTNAETIAVIGHFSFDALKEKIEKSAGSLDNRIEEYRKAVTIIDDTVAELIHWVVACEKIPIVIGGGHNNAYPIIKGTASALAASGNVKGINCVNLDAHIDYRLAEGRHSGNGFRYAKQEGFLRKYFALGIHENYIPNNILKEVNEMDDIEFMTYEDIFIRQRRSWAQALEGAVKFLGDDTSSGIELDLDSIESLPSSAITPCGVSTREALQYVVHMSNHFKVAYLHICEGIASNEHVLVGKLTSYIVCGFVNTLNVTK